MDSCFTGPPDASDVRRAFDEACSKVSSEVEVPKNSSKPVSPSKWKVTKPGHSHASSSASTVEQDSKYLSVLYSWISKLLSGSGPSEHTSVSQNLLLWCLGLHRLVDGFRLQLLHLSSRLVIERTIEFFEAILDCIEQVEKDDVVYGTN